MRRYASGGWLKKNVPGAEWGILRKSLCIWLSLSLAVGIIDALESQLDAGEKLVDHFPEAAQSGCMKCHADLELIREPGSGMLEQIMQQGKSHGDPAGCIVCHGGDAEATEKDLAHGGPHFFADPGSPWVNEQTCGQCHPKHCEVQWKSLMMTEAGKIQGVAWAFGSLTGYNHKWANYAVKNPEDQHARLGTEVYRKYMEKLTEMEPDVFVQEHEPLPEALKYDELERLRDDPSLAAFTYIRTECQRCHHAVKGRQERGDFRGMGCSSCHIPYSNEGLYEGADASIAKDKPGHMLVHSIQGTREAKVTVHDTTYSGIPVETCTTCHDRGKRIGVSFQGLMESAYESPFAEDGSGQAKLHTKHYIAMQQDIHYQKGMTCQDCHVSLDVHSDGFLAAANLAAVQIECADCHGTPNKYPWELPLGFMDEFKETPADGPARGVGDKPIDMTLQGTSISKQDGYLLTVRGNPYENVVRVGNEVVLHTAAGKDIKFKPLKLLNEEDKLSERGRVAMCQVEKHLDRMECYSCHASWTPQCYGCHVKIDFSQPNPHSDFVDFVESAGKKNFDWVAAGRKHQDPDHRNDRGETGYDTIIPGKVHEERSYLRFESPMLGVNGEGRITPLAPGCQPSVTIIGEDGKPILLNHIFRTMPGAEGSGDEGQLAIDMSPTQPHTITKNARTCESCHTDEKVLGYGIDGGRLTRPWNEKTYVDLETTDGKILADAARPQMEPIENLEHDWSRIVTEDGQQVQTVGHHFKLSRALNNDERARMSRQGTCSACHKEIPDESLAVSLLHHIAVKTGQIPETGDEHDALLHKIVLSSAWAQVMTIFVLMLGATWLVHRFWKRRRNNGATPTGTA